MSHPSPTLAATARVPEAARRITTAVCVWVSSLSAAQRASACFAFESDQRSVWTYLPGPRPGLALRDMTPAQRDSAMQMLDASLSARGNSEAQAIMALESVLAELERQAGRTDTARRHPEFYWFALFGEAGGRAPWAWRVGGHHVAVHITLVEDFVAVTPLFFGANPAAVPHGPHAGQRTLAAEEDLARDLLARLRPAQKSIAIVDPVAPDDILTKDYRNADPQAVRHGVAYAQLDGVQREALVRLVRHYIDRAAADLAAVEWTRIEAAGLDAVTFAWAGPEARGHGHYYAVCGPQFLIEYDNTQNDANHIHSVWRDLRNDWGEDLLAAHYAASHS